MNNQYDKYLDKVLQELNARSKFTPDQFEITVSDDGKLVSILRKSDGAVHEYKRATDWPRAAEFMDSLTGAQLNEVFPRSRK